MGKIIGAIAMLLTFVFTLVLFFFCRNKRKSSCSDEFSSHVMDGLQVMNGLECKIACSSSKVFNHLLLHILKIYLPFLSKRILILSFCPFSWRMHLIRASRIFGLCFWISILCFLLWTHCMWLGFICFRYRRLFISNKKEKEKFASEQFMSWTGKVFKHMFKQSTAVLQIIFHQMMLSNLNQKWYVVSFLLLIKILHLLEIWIGSSYEMWTIITL